MTEAAPPPVPAGELDVCPLQKTSGSNQKSGVVAFFIGQKIMN
jgi:hypothetical protein